MKNVILKNASGQTIAQFPKDSVERFYISRTEHNNLRALVIIHVDGSNTIIDEHVCSGINELANSLKKQLDDDFVSELGKLKEHFNTKVKTVKENAIIATTIATIYKDVFLKKLFEKEITVPTSSKSEESKPQTETKQQNYKVSDFVTNELFRKLEEIVIDNTNKTKTLTTDQAIDELTQMHWKGTMTYTEIYRIVGCVVGKDNVVRLDFEGLTPEITPEIVFKILKTNKMI